MTINYLRVKHGMNIIGTVAAWGLMLILIGRVSTAVLWMIVTQLWFKDAYVPESIKNIATMLFWLMIWGLTVNLLFLIWSRYDRFQTNRKKQEKNESRGNWQKPFPWAEITLSFSSPSFPLTISHMDVILKKEAISELLQNVTLPGELLSEASKLIESGYPYEALTLLRAIVNHPLTPPLMKKIAVIRMAQLFEQLGRNRLARAILSANNMQIAFKNGKDRMEWIQMN